MTERTYMDVEDLEVYRRLCRLHIDVCDLTHSWPAEETSAYGQQCELDPSGWLEAEP